MTYPNTIKGDELYVRCTFCGDSKSQSHAHMGINLKTGLYHCFKCNASGKVTQQILFELQIKDFPGLDYGTGRNTLPEVINGPGSSRKSSLERFHAVTGQDIFKSWWNEAHVGYYLRGRDHEKRLWGFSGFNWSGAPEPLTSSPSQPLYFVEGPYDVLHENEVCFFGIPAFSKINLFFREHFFVLKPDGDIWTQQARFMILKTLIDQLIKQNFGLMGIEFLPKASDPDEKPKSKFIPIDFFRRKLWQSSSLAVKAQIELARVNS